MASNMNFNFGDSSNGVQAVPQTDQSTMPVPSLGSSSFKTLQQISTMQKENKALKKENKALKKEYEILLIKAKQQYDNNEILIRNLTKFRSESTKSIKEKEIVTKILNLAVQAIQSSDLEEDNATKAKTAAADLLKQAEMSVAKVKASSPDLSVVKDTESVYEKAKTAKANVLRKATAIQSLAKKIKELANDVIIGDFNKVKQGEVEAIFTKEKATLEKESKALIETLTVLKNEVNLVAKQAEAITKLVTAIIAPASGNWNVIGPLFGFESSSAAGGVKPTSTSGASTVDNWKVIEKLFGFSITESTVINTTPIQITSDQFQDRFRAVNNISKSLGFGAGFPTFQQADHGNGLVYGTIFIKSEFVELRNILAKDLGNPTDDASRFRAINGWATKNGFVAGFPNFLQSDSAKGVMYGVVLLKKGAVEWRDVLDKELSTWSDASSRFLTVHDWAIKNGFVGGFPNFHQAKHEKGTVYGTLLLKKEVAEWKEILVADLSKTEAVAS